MSTDIEPLIFLKNLFRNRSLRGQVLHNSLFREDG
jgi:hypothetical protein